MTTKRVPKGRNVIRAAFLTGALTVAVAAFGQTPPDVHQHPSGSMAAPQTNALTKEVAELRGQVAKLQAALDQKHPAATNQGAMAGGMAMMDDDDMGMPDPATKPGTDAAMPMSGGCCSGMMGKMAPGSAHGAQSELPGFPGASHIYHVGSTGFFLDHSSTIPFTAEQQTTLSGIKARALTDQAAAQQKVDGAEQELWTLTSSDQPDLTQIDAKVREIEKLEGDRRIAFIRAVGEAARVLTDDQRRRVLGGAGAQRPPMGTQPGASGGMNAPGNMPPAAPTGGMGGMGHM